MQPTPHLAAEYDLLAIVQARLDLYNAGLPVPEEPIELEACATDLQKILNTKFNLHDLVFWDGVGDYEDPNSYYIPDEMRDEVMTFYETYGFLQTTGVLSSDECQTAIWEIISEVIATQGLHPDYQIEVPVENGSKTIKLNALDQDLTPYKKDILRFFSQSNYHSKVLKKLQNGWTRHRNFGACCDEANFHLPTQWKLRQDPRLMKFYEMLYSVASVIFTMNRAIAKLPGEGSDEFLHVDIPGLQVVSGRYDPNRPIGSKIVYNDTQKFSAVVGSCTKEFFDWFQLHYGPLYKSAKMDPGMLMIAKNDPKKDPCKLWNLLVKIQLEPGAMVVWNANEFHNAKPNPKDGPILFGDYSGAFVPDCSEIAQTKTVLRTCWKHGTVPPTFPSFDRIPEHGHTKNSMVYSSQITTRRNKLDLAHPCVQLHMLRHPDKTLVKRVFKNPKIAPIDSFKSMPVSSRIAKPRLTTYTKNKIFV